MRILPVLIFLLLTFSCAVRKDSAPARKNVSEDKTHPFLSEKALRKILEKEFSREGKYSTVTDDDITTERYKRDDGETILTLEKGELRTEVLKKNSGKTITRTWQDRKITTLTITGTLRTTMVLLNDKEKFVHKIITEKESPEALCFRYRAGRPVRMKNSDCLGLIPGF